MRKSAKNFECCSSSVVCCSSQGPATFLFFFSVPATVKDFRICIKKVSRFSDSYYGFQHGLGP